MKALILNDEELEIVQVALGGLADYRRRTIELGGYGGVIITFGDGCDNGTWENIFGHLAEGYGIGVTRTDGTYVKGFCTDINDDGCGMVIEMVEPGPFGDWKPLGVLAGPAIEDIACIHIY